MTWTSEELVASSCFGTLTLGGTSMNNKAWSTLNNYVLWNAATRRGENSLIPDLSGRIAQPYRKDETIRTLECVIIGDCNSAGVAHANRTSGLSMTSAAAATWALRGGTAACDGGRRSRANQPLKARVSRKPRQTHSRPGSRPRHMISSRAAAISR